MGGVAAPARLILQIAKAALAVGPVWLQTVLSEYEKLMRLIEPCEEEGLDPRTVSYNNLVKQAGVWKIVN